MVIFYSYVKLPEGTNYGSWISSTDLLMLMLLVILLLYTALYWSIESVESEGCFDRCTLLITVLY